MGYIVRTFNNKKTIAVMPCVALAAGAEKNADVITFEEFYVAMQKEFKKHDIEFTIKEPN